MTDAPTGAGPSSIPTEVHRSAFSRLIRRPVAAVALTILLLIVLACVLAPLIAPHPPNEETLKLSLKGPSSAHPLGTDELGRDILSRLLYGGRQSLLYAVIVAATTLVVGVPLGLLAGYKGGWTDRAVVLLTDIGLAIPVMIIVIVVLAVFHDYFIVAMLALGLLLAPPLIRNIRGPALAVRRELFVDAAFVAGLSPTRTVFRHIFPRVLGPILVQASLATALALQFTVGLSYLGFGAQPPDPTWGSMVAEGSQLITRNSWLLIVSGGTVALVSLCLGLVGDGIRDVAVEQWAGDSTRASARRLRRRAAAAPAAAELEPADPAAMLSVSGLSVSFEAHGRELQVTSDVSFSIGKGQTVGLVGESGCGKTSVARSIMRLLGSGGRVTAGEIRFQGRSVLGLSGADLSRFRGGSVSYVSQEPMTALDPTQRVGRQISRVLRAHGIASGAAASKRAIELLETVNLPNPEEVARLYPHELSGGMAQRVAIARAVAAEPSLLIADEPTTALDVTVQAEILKLLGSLQEKTGMSILLVSHDWGVVAELCDRAMVMYAGELVEQGPLDELLETPAHPYTKALLACRPSATTDREAPLPMIVGGVVAPGSWPDSCRFAPRCPLRVDACTEGPIPLTPVLADRESRCLRAEELLGSRAADEVESRA